MKIFRCSYHSKDICKLKIKSAEGFYSLLSYLWFFDRILDAFGISFSYKHWLMCVSDFFFCLFQVKILIVRCVRPWMRERWMYLNLKSLFWIFSFICNLRLVNCFYQISIVLFLRILILNLIKARKK